jgi:uncharacterized protein
MRQIFLLILLFFVGQWLVKALRRSEASRTSARTGAGGQAAPGAQGPSGANGNAKTNGAARLAEPMIRCSECGVHAPKSDSIVVAGQPFCCNDHARRHAARPTGRDAR